MATVGYAQESMSDNDPALQIDLVRLRPGGIKLNEALARQ